MRHERIAVVDGLNLRRRPYAIGGREYAPDLPDARLTEFGRSAQLAGAKRHATHYDDAPWQISVLVSDPTDALLDELTAAFRPGAKLVWGEGLAPRFTEIRTAQCDAIRYEKIHLAVVTFSGTREPGWWSVTDHVVVTGSHAGWGTFDVNDVEGELCTPATLRVWTSAAASLIACGIAVDPDVSYSPVNGTNYEGVSVSTSWVNVSSQSINARANAGNHIVVASLSHAASPATAMLFRVGSSFAGGTAKYQPPVRATGSSLWAEIGQISVPAGAYSPESLVTLTAPQEPGIAPSGSEMLVPDRMLAYQFPTPGAVLEYLRLKTASGIFQTFVSEDINDAASDGEGTWLAVGTAYPNGVVAVSNDDGLSFVPLAGVPVASGFTSVAYGNGAWVILSSDTGAYVSTDLETWTALGYSSAHKVSYAGSLFFISDSGLVRVSEDGFSWSTETMGITAYAGVVYHDGLYVAAGDSPPPGFMDDIYAGDNYAVSNDGLTWTGHDDPFGFTSTYVSGLASNGSLLVAVSPEGVIWVSYDAVDWSLAPSTSSYDCTGVAYGDGRFYAAVNDYDSAFLVSTDGFIWTVLSTRASAAPPQLQYGQAARHSAGTWVFCSRSGIGVLDAPIDVPLELWTVDGDRLGYRVWQGAVESGIGVVTAYPRVDVADHDELVLIHPVSGLADNEFGQKRSRLLLGASGSGTAHTVSSARAGAILSSESPYIGHPYMVAGTRNLQSATGASILQAKADAGSTTASQWDLARIPSDHGAFVATAAITAGNGLAFDPVLGIAYPISSAGSITGPALATRNFGEGFSLAPHAVNRFVDAGFQAGTLTYEVSYRPCYLHKA